MLAVTPRPERPLPPPVVAPDVYDDDYYRWTCGGHEAWSASVGASSDGMYAGLLLRARFRPGEVLVDLGCGRGELLAEAVARGAAQAVGVEYAEVAVGAWVHTEQVEDPRAKRAYARLARTPGLRRPAARNVWGQARR